MFGNSEHFNNPIPQMDKKGTIFFIEPEGIDGKLFRLEEFRVQGLMEGVALKKRFRFLPFFCKAMRIEVLA
jgi:hypothetical protein